MKTQHTPGPWRIGKRFESIAIYGAKNGEEVCEMLGFFHTPEENLSNARLIAAAPELLEALELAIAPLQDEYNRAEHTGHQTQAARAFVAARAAIAKAKGEL